MEAPLFFETFAKKAAGELGPAGGYFGAWGVGNRG